LVNESSNAPALRPSREPIATTDSIIHLLDCAIFFFFQAEDGIRDRNVTGVQTCALPILNEALFTPANSKTFFCSPAAKYLSSSINLNKSTLRYSLMSLPCLSTI